MTLRSWIFIVDRTYRFRESFCFIVIMLYASFFLSIDQPVRIRNMFLKRL